MRSSARVIFTAILSAAFAMPSIALEKADLVVVEKGKHRLSLFMGNICWLVIRLLWVRTPREINNKKGMAGHRKGDMYWMKRKSTADSIRLSMSPIRHQNSDWQQSKEMYRRVVM